MDIEARRAYVGLHLERAREDLAAARDDVAHGHARAAANRAYYVVFHAASAALVWLEVERVRHSGVQSAFGEFLVKPGHIEPEFGAIFGRSRKLREVQDYDLYAEELTVASATEAVADAERFLERMTRYLDTEGATADA